MAVTGDTQLWRRASGLHRREPDPAIGFYGETEAQFLAIAGLLAGLRADNPRLGIILIAANEPLRRRLPDLLPDFRIEALPFPWPGAATLFLSTLRIRALVHLGGDAPAALGSGLTARAVPTAALWRSAGVALTAAELLEMVGRDRKWDERRDRKLGRYLGERLFALVEDAEKRRRIEKWIGRHDTIAALSQRLKHPRTILCLGNGPSSEDPALRAISRDALFRANHQWLGRGHFEKPDVVFTGTQASMKKIRNAIFGVYGESTEKVLLMTRGPAALFSPFEYFVADKIVAIGGGAWGGDRPTSGAVMLAVAAALAPHKLVIAGIDMFSHPAGSYPGETATANAYTPAHSRDKELVFILHVLAQFGGEIEILSPVLAAEWRRFRS